MTRERTGSRRRTKLLGEQMDVEKADQQMRREAACVLEVLAGLRTPEEAAKVIGVSVPTYYNLEARALKGLLHGCRTESPGRRLALEKGGAESEQRCEELERQLQRYRSVLRNARRAAQILGESDESQATGSESGRTRRKPRVRATRAIDALGGSGPGAGAAPGAAPGTAGAVVNSR